MPFPIPTLSALDSPQFPTLHVKGLAILMKNILLGRKVNWIQCYITQPKYIFLMNLIKVLIIFAGNDKQHLICNKLTVIVIN